MIFFIHYNPADGEILGWGSGFEPEPIEGMAVAFVEPFNPDPTRQKFDGEALVDKTPDETWRARLPKIHEVRMAVMAELGRTDQFMLVDAPIDEFEQNAWRAYRKKLRELRGDPVDMVDAWPKPPDGADPIPDLRARL